MTSFYSQEELSELGLKKYGNNVLISRFARIYGAQNISVGSNVRIDDYCILSGTITIGNYVHIAPLCALFGGKSGIEISDYVGISSRCAVYAESDDYTGEALSNPMIPDKYRKVSSATIYFRKHSLVGTGCTILPGGAVGEGSSVGSMSLVNHPLADWGVYVGIPCRKIRDRKKDMLFLEKSLLAASESTSHDIEHRTK